MATNRQEPSICRRQQTNGICHSRLVSFFNGLNVEASRQDVIQFVLMVATGAIDEAGATAFFRDHTVPIEA
jgi:prophage maintenance system killer protein